MNAFIDAAVDGLGIYPQARMENGEWVYRTEWQNGWNAAVKALMLEYNKIAQWISTFDSDTIRLLHYLLDKDIAILRVRDDGIYISIMMSDTFDYATADCEDVSAEDLPKIKYLWEKYGSSGLTAWAALQRSDTPIKERITDSYKEAMLEILTNEKFRAGIKG